MTLEEAYAVLGLTPLDDFIDQQTSQNRIDSLDDLYREIGATTWMLVSAALQMRTSQILIVAPVPKGEAQFRRKLRDILMKLGFRVTTVQGNGRFHLESRNHKAFFSTSRNQQTFFGPIFHSNDWEKKAVERAVLGPFGRVREIRLKSASWDIASRDQYLAFAKDGGFLFELTGDGALALLQEDADIQAIGWVP